MRLYLCPLRGMFSSPSNAYALTEIASRALNTSDYVSSIFHRESKACLALYLSRESFSNHRQCRDTHDHRTEINMFYNRCSEKISDYITGRLYSIIEGELYYSFRGNLLNNMSNRATENYVWNV